QTDTETVRLRARLLAFGAENAALVGHSEEVQVRLSASEELLEQLCTPHEEFDRIGWLQWTGICALQLGQFELAIKRLQQSLNELPAQWARRYIATAIPLARALARVQERDRAFTIAQKTLPYVQTMSAKIFIQDFARFLHDDLLKNFSNDEECQ